MDPWSFWNHLTFASVYWDTCFSSSSSVDSDHSRVSRCFLQFACVCFFVFRFLACSCVPLPSVAPPAHLAHRKTNRTLKTVPFPLNGSTELLPYEHTYTRSEGEVVTDASVCMCDVLLAGRYLARTCSRPLAHQPLSEPFPPPPPPLLPPSLPPSHAAASPHHQTQTSVWRPRRVRTLGPVHLSHSHPSLLLPFIVVLLRW